MHVLINGNYKINNTLITNIINQFNEFVMLFLIISAFSICKGYYYKIKENKMTLNDFYKKRYMKIIPFFVIVIVLDIIVSRSITSLIEGFTSLTLWFGLLPNNSMSTVGVAWTLGIIFLFYMLFPFFVFLLDNKKRGWIVFLSTILLNILCTYYFFTDKFVCKGFINRQNFLYCMMFFICGGMIFLYEDKILTIINKNKTNKLILVLITLLFTIFAFSIKIHSLINPIKWMLLFAIWLIIGISVKFTKRKKYIFEKISEMSMEIYLFHMVVYRFIEKINWLHLFKNDVYNYVFVSVLTLIISIISIIVIKKIIRLLIKRIFKK